MCICTVLIAMVLPMICHAYHSMQGLWERFAEPLCYHWRPPSVEHHSRSHSEQHLLWVHWCKPVCCSQILLIQHKCHRLGLCHPQWRAVCTAVQQHQKRDMLSEGCLGDGYRHLQGKQIPSLCAAMLQSCLLTIALGVMSVQNHHARGTELTLGVMSLHDSRGFSACSKPSLVTCPRLTPSAHSYQGVSQNIAVQPEHAGVTATQHCRTASSFYASLSVTQLQTLRKLVAPFWRSAGVHGSQ